MARVGIAVQEAPGIAKHEVSLMRVDHRPLGIGDLAIDGERRALGLDRDLGGLLDPDIPGMVKGKIVAHIANRKRPGIRQASSRVLCRVARDMPGRLDSLAQRGGRKIRGRRRAASLTGEHRDIHGAVPGLLDGFHLASPHGDGKTLRLGHFGGGIGCAQLGRLRQRTGDEILEDGAVLGNRKGRKCGCHTCPCA